MAKHFFSHRENSVKLFIININFIKGIVFVPFPNKKRLYRSNRVIGPSQCSAKSDYVIEDTDKEL